MEDAVEQKEKENDEQQQRLTLQLQEAKNNLYETEKNSSEIIMQLDRRHDENSAKIHALETRLQEEGLRYLVRIIVIMVAQNSLHKGYGKGIGGSPPCIGRIRDPDET